MQHSLPTSRKEAITLGQTRYIGVVPCEHHTPTIRQTSNGACVDCELERSAQWREKNRDREQARQKRWKAANRGIVARQKREYRDRHRERLALERRERAKRQREANALDREIAKFDRAERKRLKVEVARQRADDLDRARYAAKMIESSISGRTSEFLTKDLYSRLKRGRRRAAKFGRVVDLTMQDIVLVGELQGWRCAHCGSRADLELDHIHPLSIGGHHTLSNVQWLCHFHNQDKRNRDDPDYRRLRGIPFSTVWDVL